MADDNLLPNPKKSKELYCFLKEMIEQHKDEFWKGKKFDIQRTRIADPIYKGEIINCNDYSYVPLNFYLIHRACNQINEACNKLWATAELYYHLKDGGPRLCDKFSDNFLQSSTMGTLYYANMSTLIGILSVFGVCSIASKSSGSSKPKFSNIVRTSEGFKRLPRIEYLDKVFKTRRKGWHEQILFMYEGFLKEGVELPVIDMGAVRSLKDSRSYFDYDVLSKTTMYYAYGYEDYFEHLPKAIDILETGINCLKNVLDPLENKCDIRFDSLKKSLPILFKKYEVKHAD